MPSPIKDYILLRKPNRDDRKSKRMTLDEYATPESSQPKEIRIIIGIKDQYVAKWPSGS
jgi:hypothetical protein